MTDETSDGVLNTLEMEDAPTQADGGDHKGQVTKLRAEAAKWRTQLRDVEKQLRSVLPKAEQLEQLELTKETEGQKLTEKIAELEENLSKSAAMAVRAQQESLVVKLAAKAGVDPEIAALLDLSKLDLEDEEKALETLGKLAVTGTAGGRPTNPGRVEAVQATDAELRELYFGNTRKSAIFGG